MKKVTATARIGKSDQSLVGHITYHDGDYYSVIMGVTVFVGKHEVELDLTDSEEWEIAEELARQARLFEPVALSEGVA